MGIKWIDITCSMCSEIKEKIMHVQMHVRMNFRTISLDVEAVSKRTFQAPPVSVFAAVASLLSLFWLLLRLLALALLLPAPALNR